MLALSLREFTTLLVSGISHKWFVKMTHSIDVLVMRRLPHGHRVHDLARDIHDLPNKQLVLILPRSSQLSAMGTMRTIPMCSAFPALNLRDRMRPTVALIPAPNQREHVVLPAAQMRPEPALHCYGPRPLALY